MSKDAPAIPLFGDAYLADTRHLSLEEHGAYLQLLMIAWRSPDCALPDDDARLSRMLGITMGRWGKLKSTVMAFWTFTNKGWVQGRLSKERAYVDLKRSKNLAAAKARWDGQVSELNGNVECERNSERNAPPPPPPQDKKEIEATPQLRAKPVQLPIEAAVEKWNEAASNAGWPLVQRLSDTRKQATRNRLRADGMDGWNAALHRAQSSPYLGQAPPWFTFDWFVKPSNFLKVIEGNYDRDRAANDRPIEPGNPMVRAGIAREARFAAGPA